MESCNPQKGKTKMKRCSGWFQLAKWRCELSQREREGKRERERDINRFEAEELLPLYVSLPMLLCFEMCATEKLNEAHGDCTQSIFTYIYL